MNNDNIQCDVITISPLDMKTMNNVNQQLK